MLFDLIKFEYALDSVTIVKGKALPEPNADINKMSIEEFETFCGTYVTKAADRHRDRSTTLQNLTNAKTSSVTISRSRKYKNKTSTAAVEESSTNSNVPTAQSTAASTTSTSPTLIVNLVEIPVVPTFSVVNNAMSAVESFVCDSKKNCTPSMFCKFLLTLSKNRLLLLLPHHPPSNHHQ